MSLLPTERLGLSLATAGVGVVRQQRGWLGRPGRVAALSAPVAQADGPRWHAPLAALETRLAAAGATGRTANLVFADRFVRYAVVPWWGKLGANEEMEQARGCLEDRYGATEGWTFRRAAGGYGDAVLACALETAFLSAARDVFIRRGMRCGAACPLFVAVWNRWRREIAGKSAALIVADGAGITVGIRGVGGWMGVRHTLWDGSETGLARAAARELALAGAAADTPRWIWAPGLTMAGADTVLAGPAARWLTPGAEDPIEAMAWLGAER